MPQAPTPSMVYDVIEACSQPGCPLCRVTERWAGRFVAAILYEEVTDPHTRGRLKESQGFCRVHAWQATQVGGTLLGMAIIYRGLLAQADKALGQVTPAGKGSPSWWRKLGNQAANPGAAARWAGSTDRLSRLPLHRRHGTDRPGGRLRGAGRERTAARRSEPS